MRFKVWYGERTEPIDEIEAVSSEDAMDEAKNNLNLEKVSDNE